MSTTYRIVHADGIVMRFANFEKAAAWADEQPATSKIAALFHAFIENPFDDGSVVSTSGDFVVRMHGAWSFTATFHRDDNSVNVES